MRRALGRGLDALIPGAGRPGGPSSAESPTTPERDVPLAEIRPNPRQPRRAFDEAALAELADSIRAQGVLQPLLVRPGADGGYELVAGERRLRAAERAGLTRVPVVVRTLTEAESLEIALVENLQRDDLTPLEEATAYQRLMEEFGHTQDEIADRVGKSRPAVANALRLLRLPEAIKQELSKGRITAGHARVLLSFDDDAAQLRAARQIVARQMSVRETEQLAAARRPAKPAPASRDPHRGALEREFSTALGTRVRIRPRGRGGRVEIEYYSNEQLQGLSEHLLRPRARFDNP